MDASGVQAMLADELGYVVSSLRSGRYGWDDEVDLDALTNDIEEKVEEARDAQSNLRPEQREETR